MEFDAFYLSRIQFGMTTAFHILFPSLTIGLAVFLVILEASWLRTGKVVYFRLYRFWVRIFALAFGVGVVSGVVLTFEFGLNFSAFSRYVGDVLGPLLAYEVLTAFFLEAGFIGIMLFGWQRVGPGLHFLATCLVGIGTVFSAFWILSANSFMHTPQGFTEGADGLLHVTSWVDVVFNPSFPYRLAHMLNASFVCASFVVAAVSAWHLLKGQHIESMSKGFSIAMGCALLVAPLQAFLGDQHGLNTLEYQPIKVAAMEGHWESHEGAPLVLFAWPSMTDERNYLTIQIPYLSSLILTHSLDGELTGLKTVPPEDRPYVPLVFFAFRIMVGIGVLLIALAAVGQWLRHKGRLYDTRWFHTAVMWAAPLPFVAVIAGWITTESGRQPWVVYEVMRTIDGLSPTLATEEVAFTLVAITIIYAIVFATFMTLFLKLVAGGPDFDEPVPFQSFGQRVDEDAAGTGGD